MSLFQGAIYLFQTEIKRSWGNVAITLGLIAFSLLMCTSTYMNILDAHHPTLNDSMHFLSDYMFILTFGSISVILTFIYGGGFGLKRDILADRLAYYRSLPIRSEQIVLSKILVSLISLFLAFIIFFAGNLVGFSIFSDFTIANLNSAFLVHIIFLYGIMMLLNNLFILVDLGMSYKNYTILSFIYIALILTGSIIIAAISDNSNSFLLWTYQFSKDQPIIAIAISIIFTVASTLATYKVTTKRLKKRNLG